MTKNDALGFLLCTKLKNAIKEFLRKPSRIILSLIFLIIFGITIAGGIKREADFPRDIRDVSEIAAGASALYILIFSVTFLSGLKSGGSFFKMADVNMIFTSPLNKRSVMFYALIQQMWASLFVGFFILFQYSAISINYDLSFGALVLIFLGYCLAAFLGQTCSMFLYTLISSSDKKINLARNIFCTALAGLIAWIAVNALQDRVNILYQVIVAANGLLVRLFPFAGWLSAAVGSILLGNWLSSLIWFTATLAAFFIMLRAMSSLNRDYYEDVLAGAENLQSAIATASEKVAPESSPKVIKVGKTGIRRGAGSQVIFYKHLLENRRSSKFILSALSIAFAAMLIIIAFFLRNQSFIIIFAISAYMQIFFVTNFRFSRELLKPYVYLIPEPPCRKMIYALMETMPRALLEGVLIFIPISFIAALSPLECTLAIIARLSFTALFTGGSLVVERIWGCRLSKTSGAFLYMSVGLILALPGIATAIAVYTLGFVIVSTTVTALLCLIVLNLPTAVLSLFLCRNTLQYAV